jgi:hypothetical protein
MPNEATTEADRAVGVAPAAPWRIKALTVLPRYCLAVTFNDDREGIVDMSMICTSRESGMYAPLKDPDYFAQAQLELGAVTWPNGADLDPCWAYIVDPKFRTVV